MDFGIFQVDFTVLAQFFLRDAGSVIFDVFVIVGWAVISWYFLFMITHLFIEYRQELYVHPWKWVLLAIDIPAINVQTPKAVEQMFAHIAGAYNQPNIAEMFWQGYKQRWFSFEIISIEGYIQFLVRSEEKFRDLIEAAVYAQYPEAEITEVEDYTESVPSKFPNNEYDMWAADFTLTENQAYPIRTYRDFEHAISKDTVLKDPMGTFLESFSRLGPGEQMWFQIIVEPTSNHWKEEAIETLKKISEGGALGHGHGHGGFSKLDGVYAATWSSLEKFGDAVFNREAGEGEEKKEEKKELAPGAGALLEGIQTKILKLGLKTKMRGVYIARKEVFKPERGVNALMGAINQFNIPSANSLAPTYKATASYLFKARRTNERKTLLMKAYKKRKMKAGKNPFVLNIEELATIWHFPMSHVKTPLVQKASGKRAEPPSGLPVENLLGASNLSSGSTGDILNEETPKKRKLVTDSGHALPDGDVKFG